MLEIFVRRTRYVPEFIWRSRMPFAAPPDQSQWYVTVFDVVGDVGIVSDIWSPVTPMPGFSAVMLVALETS